MGCGLARGVRRRVVAADTTNPLRSGPCGFTTHSGPGTPHSPTSVPLHHGGASGTAQNHPQGPHGLSVVLGPGWLSATSLNTDPEGRDRHRSPQRRCRAPSPPRTRHDHGNILPRPTSAAPRPGVGGRWGWPHGLSDFATGGKCCEVMGLRREVQVGLEGSLRCVRRWHSAWRARTVPRQVADDTLRCSKYTKLASVPAKDE